MLFYDPQLLEDLYSGEKETKQKNVLISEAVNYSEQCLANLFGFNENLPLLFLYLKQ